MALGWIVIRWRDGQDTKSDETASFAREEDAQIFCRLSRRAGYHVAMLRG